VFNLHFLLYVSTNYGCIMIEMAVIVVVQVFNVLS
jgi:hypothetical protein